MLAGLSLHNNAFVEEKGRIRHRGLYSPSACIRREETIGRDPLSESEDEDEEEFEVDKILAEKIDENGVKRVPGEMERLRKRTTLHS